MIGRKSEDAWLPREDKLSSNKLWIASLRARSLITGDTHVENGQPLTAVAQIPTSRAQLQADH